MYALKYQNFFYEFSENLKVLQKYKGNKTISPVEVEVIPDENGKYHVFMNKNRKIIYHNAVIFRSMILSLGEGDVFRARIEEI